MLVCLVLASALAACGGGGEAPDAGPAGGTGRALALPPSSLPDGPPAPGVPVADPAPDDEQPTPGAPPKTPAPDPSPSSVEQLMQPAAGVVLDADARAHEDWTAAQLRVRELPAWASWLASRRALVDAWSAKTRERPDLVGGYMHDYVDPATGLPLTWTVDAPEPVPDGSAAALRLHRAWVFHLRDYNIRRLYDAAALFRAGGDTPYRDWAAAQLDFYADHYARWPLRTLNGRARMFQHGLDEATASFLLVDAARWLTPHVDAARAARWRDALFLPMAENLRTMGSPLTNIGLWHAAAVARIGMRYGDAALVAWALDGATGTRATLAAGVNADNLWAEGSFSYNNYVIAALSGLCQAAALEGRAAEVMPERRALARLLLAPLDFRFDNGALPTPGDAAPLPAIDSSTHAAVYRTLPTWWGVQRARSQQTWDTLVDPPPALPAEPALPAQATRHFAASRMAVLRAGAWQAFVHYGQATAQHAQAEALNYELHHAATVLSSDAGTVSYGSPYHSDYFSRGASHNVPLVDGQGQAGWSPGTVQDFDAAGGRLQVLHRGWRAGVDATRSLQLGSDGLAETTTLTTTDGTPRRLGAAFHSPCTLAPLAGLQAVEGAQPPAGSATTYWSGLAAYRAEASWSVQLQCGSSRYRYSVQGDGAQTVFIGRAPTTPLPATRAVLYYEVSGTQARFAATLAPF